MTHIVPKVTVSAVLQVTKIGAALIFTLQTGSIGHIQWNIQGDSGGICITLGNDSMSYSKLCRFLLNHPVYDTLVDSELTYT